MHTHTHNVATTQPGIMYPSMSCNIPPGQAHDTFGGGNAAEGLTFVTKNSVDRGDKDEKEPASYSPKCLIIFKVYNW